jgi:hypothetical protein
MKGDELLSSCGGHRFAPGLVLNESSVIKGDLGNLGKTAQTAFGIFCRPKLS